MFANTKRAGFKRALERVQLNDDEPVGVRSLQGAQWEFVEVANVKLADFLQTFTSDDALRTAANSLVVRAAQAALTATKGAGFIAGHPAERGIRESMLFLVWSCPHQVASAMICELAHLGQPA